LAPKETRKAILASMVALSCSILLVGVFLPSAHADTGAVTPVPGSGPPNTVVGLENSFTSTSGEQIQQFFTVVITPSGSTYACQHFAGFGCPVAAFFGPGGGTAVCTVPFGGPGSFDSTPSDPGVNVVGCTGPNSAAWFPIIPTIVPALFPDCIGGTFFTPIGAPGTGSTSQVGLYQVVTCWMNASGGPGMPFQGSFEIVPSNGAPEFPLGMTAVLAVSMAIVFVLGARMRKGDVPVVSR
jgi:hypothetical protein